MMPALKNYSSSCDEIKCDGVVTAVQFSPFQWSSSLLAFASVAHAESGDSVNSNQITIGKLLPDQEAKDLRSRFEGLKEYHHDCRVTCLSWSPGTVMAMLPYSVILCAGSTDGKVTMITSDLKDTNEVMELGCHGKCVNDVSFDPHTGEHVASVGDDFRCILWNKDGRQVHEFPLKSAGMSVSFHKSDESKLAVGEKAGVIRFYDLSTFTAFMSVECGQSPLKSIVWNGDDITTVLALAGSSVVTFDTSRSSLPVNKSSVGAYDDLSGHHIVLSNGGYYVAVSTGKGNNVKVYTRLRGDRVLAEKEFTLGAGLSWHQSLSLLALGTDRAVKILHIAGEST